MSDKAEVLTETEACVNKVGLILGVLVENLETVVVRMVIGVFVDCVRVSWSSKAFKTVSALVRGLVLSSLSGQVPVITLTLPKSVANLARWLKIRSRKALGLHSVQCDVTAAFIHDWIPPEEEIYVHQPCGFKCGDSTEVLRLKRTLYGLCQSPQYFLKYFTEPLVRKGLTPSNFDPCLFMSTTIIFIIYVDDILIYCKSKDEVNDFICQMKTEDVALNKEGSADGYLSVDIQCNGHQITFTQVGLTKRIIDTLGLDSKHSTAVATPAKKAALGKDIDGPPASDQVNYASMIGMLLYLGHSRPDIAFATHQCACYTFAPKQSHVNALKSIGQFLKGTLDKGLILTPSDDLKIDFYPDADFAGLWNPDNKNDPHCIRSRTGYVICLSDCPVLWSSKLQMSRAMDFDHQRSQ